MSEFEIVKALASILIEICDQYADNQIPLAKAVFLTDLAVRLLVWVRGIGRPDDGH